MEFSNVNFENIKNKLENAQVIIKEAIVESLNIIDKDPKQEDVLLKLWAGYSQRIIDCFIIETEKRNNKQLGKRIIKYAIFKKF